MTGKGGLRTGGHSFSRKMATHADRRNAGHDGKLREAGSPQRQRWKFARGARGEELARIEAAQAELASTALLPPDDRLEAALKTSLVASMPPRALLRVRATLASQHADNNGQRGAEWWVSMLARALAHVTVEGFEVTAAVDGLRWRTRA